MLNTLFLEAEHWSVTLRRQDRIMFQDVCLLDVINACQSSEKDHVGRRRQFPNRLAHCFALSESGGAPVQVGGSQGAQPTCLHKQVRWRTCPGPGRRRLLADLSRSSSTFPTSSLQPPVNKWKSSSKKTSGFAHLSRISFKKGASD